MSKFTLGSFDFTFFGEQFSNIIIDGKKMTCFHTSSLMEKNDI